MARHYHWKSARSRHAKCKIYCLRSHRPCTEEDMAGLNRTTDLLKAEGVESMTALSAISRELDILLQIRYRMDHGRTRKSSHQVTSSLAFTRGFSSWRSQSPQSHPIRQLLTLCHDIDRNIKGATKEPAWSMIKDVLFGLAGHPMTR